MKKAHLSKWRQEGPGPFGGAPDDYKDYRCMDTDYDSPAGEISLIKRQVSEITSTSTDMEVLDLRTNVKTEVKEVPKIERLEALDLRINVRNGVLTDDCSSTKLNGSGQALDLRISNVVSLNGINPIPSCVPESLSDCDTSNLESDQTQNSAEPAETEQNSNNETTITEPRTIEGMFTNKMLPLDIIEKFNLIRNLVVAEHGLIPSNIDDPGGTRLEVAQEEIVETTTDHAVPDVNMEHAAANGYNYIMHPVKTESGTDQTSDMDLSQPSLELSQQQLEVLQNAARLGQFGQPVALQHNLMQGGMVKVQEEDVIKREQQYYQVPPIKLEPGLGLGTNQPNIAKELIDYNHNERYSNNNVTVENLYPQGVIPSVVASDDEDMEGVDSGTESCDSKDSGNKKNGERKRPGRKKGQVSKVYHLWEFIRDMLNDPNYCPTVIKWENEEEGIFRVIQSETVASLWGAKKNNRTKMTYEKMSRSIRYSRKEGYFADIPKNRGYPKKLCFKFGGKAHGWRRQVR